MIYKEYSFSIEKNTSALQNSEIFDLLMSVLGDCEFESFSSDDDILNAYIQKDKACDSSLDMALKAFPLDGVVFAYSSKDMEDVNWNEEWEKNYFSPQVFSSGRCVVRAPFHEPFPNAEIELLISPKMAFGTGNHQTTSLMIDYLMNTDVKDKTVLDMGCGTGILGLLAMKLGAKSLVSVDIDKWAYENVIEHAQLNDVNIKEIIHGDASSINGKGKFDIVLANITRNILLDDMDKYVSEMSGSSKLVLSGFYDHDVDTIVERGKSLSLTHCNTYIRDNWALVEMIKFK